MVMLLTIRWLNDYGRGRLFRFGDTLLLVTSELLLGTIREGTLLLVLVDSDDCCTHKLTCTENG